MRIHDAAESAKLPVKTVRYYDEIKLVSPIRAENGYRDYGDSEVQKLSFLAHARGLGFSLEDCRLLLSLYEDQNRASADVKSIAKSHISKIDAKLKELQSLKSTLTKLVTQCNGNSRPDCPIIKELARN